MKPKYLEGGRFESPNSSLRRSSSLPSYINLYCNPSAASTNNIQQHGGQPLPFTNHHSPPTLSSQYLEQYNNNYHQHLSIFNNQSNDNSRPSFTNTSTPTSIYQHPTSDYSGMQIPTNIQDFSHNAKIVSTNDMMVCQSDNFPQQHCNLGNQGGVTTSMNQAIPSNPPSLPNNYLHLTITPNNFQSFDQFLKENSYKYQPTSVNESLDDIKRKRIITKEDKEEEREHHQIKMTRSGTSTSCAFNMF
ncbi:predicted protein [Naegleria gruberi]|uniref:Predicted protein n=1 Tax=Naegleria gruberi TaxID=5762 RepID=D2VED6_NAEGR|nr:uncharacterized protein NAEGRDRAFT_67241 [Naegleria gruberi]EFC44859.1 predicted protein [Naegleria gruberi]|eukprot:XP_002677603.1 predicted protein [Naegleria gruberi strain NEG-M]